MRFDFKPSFARSLKSFHVSDQEEIKEVAIETIRILSRQETLSKGIGLKRLEDNYWEVRYGLKARILFRWQNDYVEFVLAGDHEDIKRFLRNI